MDPTVHDVMLWADDVTLSSGQLQKSYDWRITQWSNFANAVLGAILALISSAFIEAYKGTVHSPDIWKGVTKTAVAYIVVYAYCRIKMRLLQQEFMALDTLLMEIK